MTERMTKQTKPFEVLDETSLLPGRFVDPSKLYFLRLVVKTTEGLSEASVPTDYEDAGQLMEAYIEGFRQVLGFPEDSVYAARGTLRTFGQNGSSEMGVAAEVVHRGEPTTSYATGKTEELAMRNAVAQCFEEFLR